MRQILAIVRKDILLRFASPSEWLFFILLPVLFTFILGMGKYGSDGKVSLLVVDEAQNEVSARIVEALKEAPGLRPEVVSRAVAEERFLARKVAFWLYLPPDLTVERLMRGEKVRLLLYQQPNNLRALAVQRAIQAAVGGESLPFEAAHAAVTLAEQYGAFKTEAERQQYVIEASHLARSLWAQVPDRLEVIRPSSAPVYDPRAQASAGQLITWVFIPLFGISALLAYERNTGTLSRVMTTPTSQAVFLVGTIGGQVLMALIQMGLLVGFGVLVLKLSWMRDPLTLILLLLTSALAAGAIGVFMGTWVKNEAQANNLSILMGMVMALLGGCWYPLELFPASVKTVVHVLPTTWALEGMVNYLMRGGTLQDLLPHLVVLTGFAVVFLALGIWRMKQAQET
ncbi:ABC transporter permease [Thermanaerothrix sp. 4228-RoL]|uniref:ABC transporter permease n=2 Tax=Thermanaerothrix TaxID=1077886 RepID=A0ABU3NMK6_9CHLR|nr:ABC transporter permease [Thermanaerothrix sp. 4228-RoL]MDT8897580.1 ABC transporter permease [Thermanaerothrix sp. 4228-RoL]